MAPRLSLLRKRSTPMKKLLLAGMLLLPCLAFPAPLHAWSCCPSGCPWKFEIGGYVRVNRGCACAQAGPWYLYWPLEAHFNLPAPTGYPFWPNPMALPGMAPGGPAAPPPVMPPVPTAEPLKPAIHPVGYYDYQPPSYWYPR
jgi:hypothetical protein